MRSSVMSQSSPGLESIAANFGVYWRILSGLTFPTALKALVVSHAWRHISAVQSLCVQAQCAVAQWPVALCAVALCACSVIFISLCLFPVPVSNSMTTSFSVSA